MRTAICIALMTAVICRSAPAYAQETGAQRASTARASVTVLDTAFRMPQLDRTRRVWIYLPPDYARSDKRYPVLYLHDGQNVFDAATSYVGEWGVDETLDSLHAAGVPVPIVVAVDHGGTRRIIEYSPWPTKYGPAEGVAHTEFLAQTLKPWIDARYRTLTDAAHTGIGGSSMGGLISFYATLKYPDVFGRALVFSPAFWIAPAAYDFVASARPRSDTRVYMISGAREVAAGEQAGIYQRDQQRMVETLVQAGFNADRQISASISPDGEHSEWFWRREFAAAYQFLFGQAQESNSVTSPDGRTVVQIAADSARLYYTVQRDGRELMLPSQLGFLFRNAPPLRDSLRITSSARRTVDQTWTQPWGEVARVRDHHNELRLVVQEQRAPRRTFNVVFRVFNDGLGFRYELPAQPDLAEFEIMDELTEFAFADDARAWWIPSNRARLDRSEMLYSSSPLSLLDSVQTPLTMETRDRRTALSIHEADLVDYPRMFLAGVRNMEHRTLRAALAPYADGVKVRGRTPFNTPWRTIQIADRVHDLVPAVLGLNLNPPSRIADTRWIKPMKYVGIWWGMHINTMTWHSGPRHGATTANTRRYIDFAAANNMGGVLVEGWNLGWDGDWIANRDAFSFTQPYPDYDLRGLAAYAQRKGVELIAHNETSGGLANYERQMEEAYRLYQSLGINAIKSGYVADTVGGGHSHYGQVAVRHHRRAIETAARHQIMLDVHEPIHDTGERRTWPNMMTREGSRGQEYNAWGGEGGNPPEHETILFFTRMLSGPMDFTPGIFDILIQRPTGTARKAYDSRVRTTLAKQLALYVVLYSPMQMAADEIENYAGQPAFKFIRDVGVDWEQTRVVDARIGDYVIVARQQRGAQDWYLGAITDEEPRSFDVALDFLPAGQTFVAEIYADGPQAHWLDNPLPVAIREQRVTSTSRLRLDLAPGGGQAIRFRAAR